MAVRIPMQPKILAALGLALSFGPAINARAATPVDYTHRRQAKAWSATNR